MEPYVGQLPLRLCQTGVELTLSVSGLSVWNVKKYVMLKAIYSGHHLSSDMFFLQLIFDGEGSFYLLVISRAFNNMPWLFSVFNFPS